MLFKSPKMFEIYTLHEKAKQLLEILDSIVVSIPACHAGDRGSIPRQGEKIFNVHTAR